LHLPADHDSKQPPKVSDICLVLDTTLSKFNEEPMTLVYHLSSHQILFPIRVTNVFMFADLMDASLSL
jgi:hypothetical protein